VPEVYVITTPAAHNGVPCLHENGTTQLAAPCTNPTPCQPATCNGTCLPSGPCLAACEASGVVHEVYVVYSEAVDGGNLCPVANQTARYTTACNSTVPCPIDCAGSWVQAAPCSAGCNATGYLTEQFIVSMPAAYGGASCSANNGDTRQLSCVNPNPCPITCQGLWLADGPCLNATCGGGAGLLPEIYIADATDASTSCPFAHHQQRFSTACASTEHCPVACRGHWVAAGCTATCGSSGLLYEQFVETTPASYGGQQCRVINGGTRLTTTTCFGALCPVDCVGQWHYTSTTCPVEGVVWQQYLVLVEAAHGGTRCAFASNDTRQVICNRTQPSLADCTGAAVEVVGSSRIMRCRSIAAGSQQYVYLAQSVDDGSEHQTIDDGLQGSSTGSGQSALGSGQGYSQWQVGQHNNSHGSFLVSGAGQSNSIGEFRSSLDVAVSQLYW